MAIEFQHAVDVRVAPESAFAVLDDVARTPEWLARCTGIDKLSEGPNAAGTRLRYHYRDGGRTGVMEGQITERLPNEHLRMQYADRMMDVNVDFRVSKSAEGARLVHAIAITPKSWIVRLFSPLIRRQLPDQTITAMQGLKALLESSPPAS